MPTTISESNRIGRRLARRALGIGLVIGLAVTLAQVLVVYALELQQVKQQLSDVERTHAKPLANSIWLVNDDEAGVLLDGLATLPGVAQVVLRDDEGRTLSRGTRPEAVLAERRYPLQPNIPGAYGVGELTVIIGPDELAKKVLRRSLFATITLLAALVACVMALVVMFRNQVTRHLVTMARHAANLRLDAFDQPLVLSGKLVDVPPDEIDQLAGSFQQMLARISADLKSMQRYEAELSAHRDHLEKLVQTRTIELEEKAKQLEEQRALQEKLANTDALTGTLSRRHFLELAERELARAGRTRESVAVIALDLDHFKVINDTYGHAGGDNVLRWFSRTCESQLRAIDLFGRIGGEEFAILLPNSDEASALRVAERLRSAIESLPVAIGDGRFHATTVSIGLATSSRDGETLDSLLAAADGALYDAKRAGRNRIMLASKA